MQRLSRSVGLAVASSAVLAASRLHPAPALIDAAGGSPVAAHLKFPFLHVLFTPFASLADLLTCNGARQDYAFVVLILLGFGLFRFFGLHQGPKKWFDRHDVGIAALLYFPFALGFLAWAVVWPHDPPRLVLDDPDAIAVDIHSHTSFSWDGRRIFTPERNADWHEKAGFGAAFVTDHNTTDNRSAVDALDEARRQAGEHAYASLHGEEVSLHNAHIVVLGEAPAIDRTKYSDDEEGVRRFLSDMRAAGNVLTVLSLPEYWYYYRGEPTQRLAAESSGIEIWTSSPKAMDFPASQRAKALALAQKGNLFIAGATDNHGYGSCACVWNVLKIPGWRGLEAPKRQEAVMAALRRGFSAVQVLARPRVEESRGNWVLLDGPLQLWHMVRTWNGAQCLAALLWAWLLPALELRAKW